VAERPSAFADLREQDFPLTIEFIAMDTGEVVHIIEVTGPGAVEIPGLSSQHGPVMVRTVTGEGVVAVSFPPTNTEY
jgi:hypothetical protein